ncbi:MAG: ComEC/Rec2 family competence protein [Flavobacteriales bacterium]|nr:ComEC/Rec2 family competence protein [Flavobacteriales bacterium]
MASRATFIFFVVFVCATGAAEGIDVGNALCGLIASGAFMFWAYYRRLTNKVKTISCLLFTLCVGLSYGSLIYSQEKTLDSKLPYYRAIDISGVINDVSPINSYGSRRITIGDISSPQVQALPRKYSLQCYIDSTRVANVGDSIKGRSLLLPIKSALSADDVDYASIFRKRGVIGSVRGENMTISISGNSELTLRERIIKHIVTSIKHIDINDETSQILLALTIGEKDDMSPSFKNALSSSGIIHLFTVSGMHVALLAALVWGLTFFMSRKKLLRRIIVISSLFFYAYLCDGTAPVMRAVFMFTFISIASINPARNKNSLNALGLSGLLYIILYPQEATSAGFAMSYTAAAAIIIFYERYAGWKKKLPKVPAYFLFILLTTLCAEMALMPFILYHFGKMNMLFPFANLLMIPYVTLYLFPLSWFVMLSSVIGFCPKILVYIYELSCDVVYEVSSFFNRWPTMINIEDMNITAAIALALVVWGAILFICSHRKTAIAMSITGCIVALCAYVADGIGNNPTLCYDTDRETMFIYNNNTKIDFDSGERSMVGRKTLCRAASHLYVFPRRDFTLVADAFFYPQSIPDEIIISPLCPYHDVRRWIDWCDKYDVKLYDMRRDGYFTIKP